MSVPTKDDARTTPAPVAVGKLPTGKDDKRLVAMSLRSDVEMHYSKRNKMMQDMRERRYQDKAVEIPEAYRQTAREVRLPLLADTIDLMVAICDDAPWNVHVDPYDETQKAYRNSSLREGKWRWRAPLFPTKLSSVVRGLSNSPSLCPPAFPLSEQNC